MAKLFPDSKSSGRCDRIVVLLRLSMNKRVIVCPCWMSYLASGVAPPGLSDCTQPFKLPADSEAQSAPQGEKIRKAPLRPCNLTLHASNSLHMKSSLTTVKIIIILRVFRTCSDYLLITVLPPSFKFALLRVNLPVNTGTLLV